MQEVENKLRTMEVEGQVSQGMVKVIMNGKGEVKILKLILVKRGREILEDLLMAAISEAKKRLIPLSALR